MLIYEYFSNIADTNLDGWEEGNLGKREIKQIEDLPEKAPADEVLLANISVNYPEATKLSIVLADVARWSEMSFVMDPQLNRSIQIFSSRKLNKEESFRVFVASLESIGLRVIVLEGRVAKIVPSNLGKVAV